MMLQAGDIRQRRHALSQAWRGFWFRVEPAYTIGLVRIVFGALVVLWAIELKTNLYIRFGTEGVLPRTPSQAYTWTVFELFPSDNALLVGWIVLMVAAIALTVGWHSRLAAILVFILIVSFERRNPWVFNAGDMLLRIEALFIALAPCGAALSLDQRRRTGAFWSAQDRQIWALRLLQIQVSIIYISIVVAKLRGETWQNGTAVSYSLRQYDMLVLPLPDWVAGNLTFMNVMTWGTLVIELAIGIFVWNRRWRPWVLAAGVVLHLSITVTIAVGLFSFAMFVLYLAFIPADRVKTMVDKLKQLTDEVSARLTRRRKVAPLVDEEDARDEGDDQLALEHQDLHRRAHEPTVAPIGASRRTLEPINGVRRSAEPERTQPGHSTEVRDAERVYDHRHRVPDTVRVPVPARFIQPDDAPTGRHARRPDTPRRNGELTGHTT
ncbi:HTTM domain-containing protein [Mycobacterium sp. B14F4]|uniref:HTTM domain-containing protein n=1 Tax=Mycobacterium sp. B14F4 TaxID=3153565 RepID=UPI00325DC441